MIMDKLLLWVVVWILLCEFRMNQSIKIMYFLKWMHSRFKQILLFTKVYTLSLFIFYSFGKNEQEKLGISEEWFHRLWDSDYNALTNCDCLPSINLTLWQEF